MLLVLDALRDFRSLKWIREVIPFASVLIIDATRCHVNLQSGTIFFSLLHALSSHVSYHSLSIHGGSHPLRYLHQSYGCTQSSFMLTIG